MCFSLGRIKNGIVTIFIVYIVNLAQSKKTNPFYLSTVNGCL